MGLIDLDKVILGQGEDFPPTENFLQLQTQQGQINWLAQALTELNDAAEGSTYELPVATADTLGGIKQGDGLTIAADGTASVTGSAYELPVATADTLGGIKQGDGLTIAADGTASVTGSAYELPVATADTLGGIKQGDGLTIAADGTASASLGTGLEFDENGAIQATATSTLTKQLDVKGISVKAWQEGTTASIAYQITDGHTYDVNNDLLFIGPSNTSQKVWTNNGVYVSSIGTTSTAGQVIITFTADTTPTEMIIVNVAIIY